MKFIFWQNVVSIHQSAFISALSRAHDVTLVAEKDIDDSRKADGWSIPSMGDAKVVVHPDESHVTELLSQSDAEHVFSGIDAFPFLYEVFKKAVKKELRISVMMEPFNEQGLKGSIRKLKYSVLMLKFSRHIRHFFITGTNGIRCYKKVGAPSDKLHQWGYFTAIPQCDTVNATQNKKPKLIFVGQLIDRKNIELLLDIYPRIERFVESFTIIGQGVLREKVSMMARRYDNIVLKGAVDNKEVQNLIRENDYLILPSKFDGWGAVVNEALLNGTRVLCSENVGASVLLDGDSRGESFPLQIDSMVDVLLKWLKKTPLTAAQRQNIKDWAVSNICGVAVSAYFADVIAGEKAEAPWIIN